MEPASPLSRALWIWPDNHSWDVFNCYALFRKMFRLPKVPARAPLFITADQSYALYINGRYVCRGPARGFQKNWPYDEVDVRAWLQPGENLIAVRAYNPGRSSFQYIHEGYGGFLMAAEWGKTRIVSDGFWKCRRQAGVNRNTVPASLQLFPQEDIDLRVEDPGWMLPGFRETPDWSPRHVAACPWNGLPWCSLEARGIPMLEEREIRLGRVIGAARGVSAPGFRTARDLTASRHAEGLAHRPAAGGVETLRFPRARPGTWNSVLIDLGKLHVGCVLLDIRKARGGEVVETHHFETLDAATLTPDYDPAAGCRMAFSHRLTCRAGRNRHAFHHPFGFRYMVVTVRDNPAELVVSPSLRTTVYPLQTNGAFASSDTGLNAIWETCAWTQRMCSLDAYVDTPWREQAQWWGDARVQAWNTFHLDGDARLFRRGIRQIASQTTPDGVTYGHAPTTAHGCVLPDFTLIWMLTLWDYYWQTGSLEPFREHRTVVEKALAYFREWTDPKTGLLRHDRRFWLFLDWTDLRKEGCSSVYSLWLLHTLERLTEMYRLSSLRREAGACRQWAAALRRALRRLVGRDGLMRDGYTPEGRIDPETSVHAQTLAILNRLAPEHETAMLEKRLLPCVRGQLAGKIQPSAYWVTYIYSVLAERGHGSAVLDDIRTRWAPMVGHGTTWENFQPKRGHESHSHAWAAHPLFHLMQILGGIRQTAPAWAEILYAPEFAGDRADITVPTPHGPVHSAWERKGGAIAARLRLPAGLTARVRLSGQKEFLLSGPASKIFMVALTDS